MSDWTEERTELVKLRWKEGYSATEISRELNCGLSRNAVIGKIHRLGLTGPNTQGQNSATKYRSTLPRCPRPEAAPAAKSFAPRVVQLPKPEPIGPWDEFPERGCKHIEQHPAIQTWRCCGAQQKTDKHGKPLTYCEYHWQLNHQPKAAPEPAEDGYEPVPEDDRVNLPIQYAGIRITPIHAVNRKRAA